MRFLRALAEVDPQSNPGDPIRFVASSAGIKRDGRDLDPARWLLENYRKNPVVLWSHDYWGFQLPIGRSTIEIAGEQMLADVTFDQGDEFAREIERKYRNRFLHAVSVGWDDWVQIADGEMERVDWRYEERQGDERFYELLDVSGVVMPGDPDAVMERQQRAFARLRAALDGILDGPEVMPEARIGAVADEARRRVRGALEAGIAEGGSVQDVLERLERIFFS